ncbi:hypothetical protein Gotri_011319 [Gossypium trilobum]|uniref:DDE-1 domain-containing protein n=1 Tax=Gossypium trilobum TaxID=34281 RepID=A0A7J9ETW8_9ROSI|nr:hypothetical protein [Gossypium trilobum]
MGLSLIEDLVKVKNMYNMDKIGLFYRLQVDHSLATKQLEGRKKDKERLTAVVCCNGDGANKVPLWVISKFANPRCFKHVNIDNLNCHYRAVKIYYRRPFYSSILEGYEKG